MSDLLVQIGNGRFKDKNEPHHIKMNEITIILNWSYSPSDFFEEPMRIEWDRYEITIEDGKVEVHVETDLRHQKPNFREELHEEVNTVF